MLFGVVLAITWLILLLRYPTRALPLSLAALAGLAMLAGLLLWQDARHNARLESLTITLRHDRQQCPAERPLHISLHNPQAQRLDRLNWQIEAWLPGESINLVQVHYDNPRYSLPQPLPAGQTWQDCLPLPALRRGYRAASLEYRATNLHGVFHNQ